MLEEGMKKILVFVGILFVFIVMCRNVKEGLITAGPYSDNAKKLELLNELKGLSERAKQDKITTYATYSVYFEKPYNTDMNNETPSAELVEFIKNMSSTKMSVLKTSEFLSSNVKTSLTNLVASNENNSDGNKRVTDNNTLSTARNNFNNKVG